MMTKFLFCGLIGWIMEILWTGLHSLFRGDPHLTATTSLWMFPIYGMAVFLLPISQLLSSQPWVLRGLIYMVLIFTMEYITGWWLRATLGACPWDYSGAVASIHGLIRLDYAPVWFFAGLIFERILQAVSL